MAKEFRQGQHICVLYETPEQQILTAVEYVRDGLRRRERCLYVAAPSAVDQFRSALAIAAIDVPRYIASGALLLATHADAHLRGGCFDSERMLGLLNEYVDQAMKDGFSGLRTCGDMSWLLDGAPGSDQVVEYEAFLSGFFQGVPASGMCMYDQRRIGGRLIHQALCSHSMTIRAALPSARRFIN